MFDAFLPFDGAIAQWAAQLFHPGANPFWDGFFAFITRLGDGGLFWIAIAAALLAFRRTRKAGIVMLLAFLLNVIVTNAVLKPLLDRPRPYDINFVEWAKDYIYPNLTHMPGDKSFPSGHTAISFAGAMGLFFGLRPVWVGRKGRPWAIIAIALAALVGFSRVYLGVHYATDVIGGILVGALCGLAAMYLIILLEPILNRRFPKIFRS